MLNQTWVPKTCLQIAKDINLEKYILTLNLKNNKLEIVATDLDIVFYDEISELKVVEEGNTTFPNSLIVDYLRIYQKDN